MTSEGLGEMFEGDFADTCGGKFPLLLMGERANGQACLDGERGRGRKFSTLQRAKFRILFKSSAVYIFVRMLVWVCVYVCGCECVCVSMHVFIHTFSEEETFSFTFINAFF